MDKWDASLTKKWLFGERTSSVYLQVKLKNCVSSFFFLSCRKFWMNTDSYEYKNNPGRLCLLLVSIEISILQTQHIMSKVTNIQLIRTPEVDLHNCRPSFITCIKNENNTISIAYSCYCFLRFNPPSSGLLKIKKKCQIPIETNTLKEIYNNITWIIWILRFFMLQLFLNRQI